MKQYDKLVRDRIPEIIEKDGRTCKTIVLSDEECLEYLNKKLLEETNEYLESKQVEELADLEEVLRAILKLRGVNYEDFEKIRNDKVEKRGAFDKKLLLKETD